MQVLIHMTFCFARIIVVTFALFISASAIAQTHVDNVWVLSPSVGVPTLRANVYKDSTKHSSSQVNINAFNAIAVGVMLNKGSLDFTDPKSLTDPKSTDGTFNNRWGVGLGLLFSVTSNGAIQSGGSFAPIATFNIFDFQLFYGHDFGSVDKSYTRGFIGLSYGLNISRVFNSVSDIIVKKPKDSGLANSMFRLR
jgi:hypothetical protein